MANFHENDLVVAHIIDEYKQEVPYSAVVVLAFLDHVIVRAFVEGILREVELPVTQVVSR